MIARTCACGTTIVCADLYGWDVWLDQQPSRDGMYTITAGQAVIDTDGRHRRHVCQHSPDPADTSPASPGQIWTLAENRDDIARRAAARSADAARTVLAAGTRLSLLEQQIAKLSAGNPDLTSSQLAARAGVQPWTCRSALARIRRTAARLDGEADNKVAA